ncbi:BMP family ABC transporter substrate-binding protein [Xylanimonas allomyrinae]|uniref:BMP family ABC transporter substrate-binding protein n=1 Tax=Xylanimonas allomyrinae TaxID=2509459 RepID=A0A4P6ELD6_9MICO|nr:ABC transporter substrate-binding protein [Xylanimonas allomyrinae]QAY63474.1 BMP family ABC transporter substrate-binding protein [Xylanimonas allomyrinae]
MKIRRAGAAVAALALALGLAACSSGAGAEEDTPYIAIVSKGFQHQFWQAVKQGAQEEAERQNVRITFDGPADETDIEGQIDILGNAITKKPDALGFAAIDSNAAAPLLEQAKGAGIPVIAFDSGVDSDIPLTIAATDNKAAAAEAAKHLADLVGGKGTVAMVVHDQTSQSGTDRRDGFAEWMKANAPGITLLPVQYGGSDQGKSADITKSILQAHPDIAGIYGSNEGTAIGIVKGIQESGTTGVVVVGFDSGQAQIDAIRSGLEAGAITQDPVGMGAELVKAAVKAIDGEDLPPSIDTGFYWYDKSNIDDPKIDAVLYE